MKLGQRRKSRNGSAELQGDTFNVDIPPGSTIEWTLACTPAYADGVFGERDFNFTTAASELRSLLFSCGALAARLTADPAALAFGDVAVGRSRTQLVHITQHRRARRRSRGAVNAYGRLGFDVERLAAAVVVAHRAPHEAAHT